MICFTTALAAVTHPLDLPFSSGVFSGTTTAPTAPAAAWWMCAAAARVARFGTSSAAVIRTPFLVAVRIVRGHAPRGAGMMSAACFPCARSWADVTWIFVYGVFAELVRWQIDRVAAEFPLA